MECARVGMRAIVNHTHGAHAIEQSTQGRSAGVAFRRQGAAVRTEAASWVLPQCTKTSCCS